MRFNRYIICILLVLAVLVGLTGSVLADNARGETSVNAQNGGSIYNAGTMNMSGGKVYGGSAQYGGNIYNSGVLNLSGLAKIFDGIAGTLGHDIANAPGSTFTDNSASNFGDTVVKMHSTCTCGSNREPHAEGCINDPKQIWTPWTSTDTLPTFSGHYYLVNDVTIKTSQDIDTNEDIYIDLNGKTVTRDTTNSDAYRVFNMHKDNGTTASLTILDSAGNGGFVIGESTASGSFLLIHGATKTFNMYGGYIDGSEVSNNSEGVIIRNVGQTVNLYGGMIRGGTTTKAGGTIYTSGALNIVNAAVYGGTANNGGNIYVSASGTLSVKDPLLVSGGTATGSGYAKSADICYESNGFQIGFGKASITPETQVMTGEGTLGDVIEPIYSTAIVMQDANGGIYVSIAVDLSWGGINTAKKNGIADEVRAFIEDEFGINGNYVAVSGTHNHSSVDYAKGWSGLENPDENTRNWRYGVFVDGVKASVAAAMEDCAPAKMYTGSTYTKNLTFVRRYLTTDSKYDGYWDGFNKLDSDVPSNITHETEADEQVQLVKFVRDGKKDILMINWQSHATRSDGNNFVGPDFIGPLRDKVEKELGVHCVFYQGACGNLAPISRISGENTYSLSSGWEAAVKHGELVADYVIAACNNSSCFTKVETGSIQLKQIRATAYSSRVDDEDVRALAQTVKDYYNNVHNLSKSELYKYFGISAYLPGLEFTSDVRLIATNNYIKNMGYDFESYYHAKAILDNKGIERNKGYEINVISIGDVAFATLPVELSDVTGMQIKEGSPFKTTLLLGYTCGTGEYVMHDAAYENGGYETYTTYFARGTAEIMRDQYLDQLNGLYDTRY